MKNQTIRQYQKQDKDDVWKLHVDGLNQTTGFKYDSKLDDDFNNIKSIYLDNNGEFYIAEIDDKVIGMGALRKVDKTTAEIKRMRVNKKFQGQGIGSKILEKLINRAKELGYHKLVLDTSVKQIPAQKLYEKFGFKKYKQEGNTIYYKLDINKELNEQK